MHEEEPALLQRAARGAAAFAGPVALHEVRLRHFLACIVGPADIPAIGEVLGGAPLAVPAAAGLLLLGWLALGQPRGARALV